MRTEEHPIGRTYGPETLSQSALKSVICECARETLYERYGDRARALVLTGSLARNEATFVFEDDRWHLLGDVDFFLVFRRHTPLPKAADLEETTAKIENRLSHCRIDAHVGVNTVSPHYMETLHPTIASYELRTHGHVVCGEPEVLSLIPAFDSSAISHEDAWRMLCNRTIEFLEHASGLCSNHSKPSSSCQYSAVKLILDCATSYLVFCGLYAPTFCARAEQLRKLSNEYECDGAAPFSLKSFSDTVWQCTQWKLSKGAVRCVLQPALWKEAIRYAQLLWRWEMLQLTSAPETLDDRSLWTYWRRHQGLRGKVLGWLSVLRRRKGYANWFNWPRWIRLSLQSSPRHLIYQVAIEILVRLPELAAGDEPTNLQLGWNELRTLLPELAPHKASKLEWQQLAAAVVWNYKEFLVNTQS